VNVNIVEAIWFGCTSVGFVTALFALRDARRSRTAIRALNGTARELLSSNDVRRESLTALAQALLLTVVVPFLFIDNPAVINLAVIAFILVPALLTANSLLDARGRRNLAAILRRAP
jgi:hypothetical protein